MYGYMDQAVISQVLSEGPVDTVLPSDVEQMSPEFKESIFKFGHQIFFC